MKQSVYNAIRKLIGGSAQPKYTYRPDHNVINDFSHFSGIPTDEIERRIRHYKELSRHDWNKTPGKNFQQKANCFYSSSKNYIFDLLSANYSTDIVVSKLNRFTPKILDSIRTHPGDDFLEFGGGTGVFCELVAQMGKCVTYLDIPGQPFDFAKWRFRKYNVPVRMICSNPARLELTQNYDIIFTDAVVEHLPEPQSVTRELCNHTRKDGLLILLVDLSGEVDEMPMHRDVNIQTLHAIIQQEGFRNDYGMNMFCSIWRKV